MAKPPVVIIGGGVAGTIAAAALGADHHAVICCDAASEPPPNYVDDDDRVVALMNPAIEALSAFGIWHHASPSAVPIDTLRFVEPGPFDQSRRHEFPFVAGSCGLRQFGHVISLSALSAAARARCRELSGVRFQYRSALDSLSLEDDQPCAHLHDGTSLTAQFLVGADGRASTARRLAGIPHATIDTDQVALTFTVSHDRPHRNEAIEIYDAHGPFTLVPRPGDARQCTSSVVWMERHRVGQEMTTLGEDDFESIINRRSLGYLGSLKLCSRRRAWPVSTQLAAHFYHRRLILIGEAAHAVPPIGAQGLNMTIADIVSLKAALDATDTVGAIAHAARQRHRDASLRCAAVAGLNAVASGGSAIVRTLRLAGLGAVHGITPLHELIVAFGLGGIRRHVIEQAGLAG